MRTHDWIGLLEASYDLASPADDWLRQVRECATAFFVHSPTVVLFVARVTPSRIDLEKVEAETTAIRDVAVAVNEAGPEAVIDLMYRNGPVAGTLSERVFPRVPEARRVFLESMRGLAEDMLGTVGRASAGRMALLLGALPRPMSTTPAERRRWHLAMTHLGAGLRLRAAFADDAEGGGVEAVLDPDGRIQHAEGPARDASARDALRDAAVRIDRARSHAGRCDPEAAMESWSGLVEGRWSLVDRFERDGKRFVVAHRNEPSVVDPRGLTRRERQIAELVGMGRSTKEIAYELGVSLSAVSMAVKTGCRKLGLGARTELASFFAPGGLRARLEEASLNGETLLVGAHPLLDEAAAEALSPAEREVTSALLAGSTSLDIASRRGTSVRTIANQIASIFEKLGVHSRVELAARLHADAGPVPTRESPARASRSR
ncbi:MAG: helix-turn-helix transcriptional regulator [Myxococcota bacterium]